MPTTPETAPTEPATTSTTPTGLPVTPLSAVSTPSDKNETPAHTRIDTAGALVPQKQEWEQEREKVLEILNILASDKAITDTEEETHEKIRQVIDLGDSTEQAARKIEDAIYRGVLTVIQLVENGKVSVDNIDLFHSWRARLENRNQPLGTHDPLRLRDLFRSVRMEG